jgi:hypothetical protein
MGFFVYSPSIRFLLYSDTMERFDSFLVYYSATASDKCNGESECMSFEHYIRAAEQLWIPHLLANNRGGRGGDDQDSNHHNASSSSSSSRMATTRTTTILVTTESRAVLQEQEAFLAKYDMQRDFAFPFRIVNNRHDVMQGTGFINDALAAAVTAAGAAAAATAPQETLPVERIRRRLDNTTTATTIKIANNAVEQVVATLDADAVMLSAVSSLKAQLMANVVIGNCCSNFHQLLRELIEQGCGGAGVGGGHVGSTTFYCLQDHPNPDYRLCCSWDKSSRCMEKRQRREREQQQTTSIGSNHM